jgi:hypothetical protein
MAAGTTRRTCHVPPSPLTQRPYSGPMLVPRFGPESPFIYSRMFFFCIYSKSILLTYTQTNHKVQEQTPPQLRSRLRSCLGRGRVKLGARHQELSFLVSGGCSTQATSRNQWKPGNLDISKLMSDFRETYLGREPWKLWKPMETYETWKLRWLSGN